MKFLLMVIKKLWNNQQCRYDSNYQQRVHLGAQMSIGITLKLISRVRYFETSKYTLWLFKKILFRNIGRDSLRMGCDQIHSLNKKNFPIFFSKNFFSKYPYKSYVTIENIFGHIISHIIMFSTMFWVPGVTLLRLLRCTNKRHFDLSKEHSGTFTQLGRGGHIQRLRSGSIL